MMMMIKQASKPRTLVFLMTLLSCLIVLCTCKNRGMVGGRTEIKDVKNNQEVQKLGRYCVEEYNKSLKTKSGVLMFSEVVEAQQQVVSGIKYFMKIAAVKDGVTRIFDSVVWVKPWLHNSKQVLQFGLSTAQPLVGI